MNSAQVLSLCLICALAAFLLDAFWTTNPPRVKLQSLGFAFLVLFLLWR